MADDADKQDNPQLPPKLNLRKQGILKKEPAPNLEHAAKRETSRLVVTPSAPETSATPTPDPKEEALPKIERPGSQNTASAAKSDESPLSAPAIKLKPLMPKPAATPIQPMARPETKASVADGESPREVAPQADTKRKTSRIPLEAATPAAKEPEGTPAGIKPKTITIKPTAPIPKIRSTQPLNITVPIVEDVDTQKHADAEKRKTSRIPLEEALTADKESDSTPESDDPARPKTIKIKRPGSTTEATPIKIKNTSDTQDAPAPGDMSKTARLDHLPLDDIDTATTQKKTIRVKRPTPSSGSGPEIQRTGPGGISLTPPEPLFEVESDEPGALWALLSLAATLVLCVVIYMLAAQAIGPNTSGTQISAWKNGPNLSWPGKIIN